MLSKPIALLALLGALACVATAAAQSGDRSKDRTATRARAAGSELAATVGVFRRARQAGDELPAELVSSPLNEGDVLVASSSRRVRVPGAGHLVRTRRNEVCQANAGFLTCAPIPAVSRRGFAPSVTWRGDDFRVSGIAADSVGAVTVKLADGTSHRLDVEDNVVLLEAKARPVSLAWSGPGGREQVTLPGPAAP